MRRDWDERARENAQHFIACGHSETDAAFWESGRRDLELSVLHDVELDPTAHALEIGCGIGRLLRPLSERIAKVYGVDISSEMIERARRALADRPNIELFATRGRLDFIPDASLDFVYSFIVFQHIPTKKAVSRYIREAGRVLSEGGVFRFQVDGRPRSRREKADTWLGVWYEPGELTRELQRAGFETVDLWGEHTHYLWATARRRGGKPGRRPAAVRTRPRKWNRPALEAFLSRLGTDVSTQAPAVLSGRLSLRETAAPLLSRYGEEAPEAFVSRAYQVLLGREADPDGLAFYAKEIASGIPASNTVDCLVSSAELEEKLRPETPGEDPSRGPSAPSPAGRGSG
jgi:SAM-dependent methyltransferase